MYSVNDPAYWVALYTTRGYSAGRLRIMYEEMTAGLPPYLSLAENAARLAAIKKLVNIKEPQAAEPAKPKRRR